MLSLNDAMLKKRQEPAFATPWDALEPEEQICLLYTSDAADEL